jgi:putative acyl-CoA dehydrogenase
MAFEIRSGASSDPFGYSTHEVSNQPPPLADYDAFGSDPVLQKLVGTFNAAWSRDRLHRAGRTVGSAQVQEWAQQANRHIPELRTHDRFGNRVDRIDLHPAWHELMALSMGQETHALAWTEQRPGAQVARAALSICGTRARTASAARSR